MAQFLVLIYEDEVRWDEPDADLEAVLTEHTAFNERHRSTGAVVGGNALEPTATATSLRRGDDGSITVTDGPFVETKEALGGYYVLEAPDLDAAIALAKQVPAPFGGVEVRPVRVFD
jgi:hypothetical protein